MSTYSTERGGVGRRTHETTSIRRQLQHHEDTATAAAMFRSSRLIFELNLVVNSKCLLSEDWRSYLLKPKAEYLQFSANICDTCGVGKVAAKAYKKLSLDRARLLGGENAMTWDSPFLAVFQDWLIIPPPASSTNLLVHCSRVNTVYHWRLNRLPVSFNHRGQKQSRNNLLATSFSFSDKTFILMTENDKL